MDHLRLSAVVSRVVAWHNRHPLARRIGAAQVHAVGYVALPFTGPAPQPAAPSAAVAAAEAIAAAAAATPPLHADPAEPAPALAEGGQGGAGAAAPTSTATATAVASPEAAGHERSRLRERVLARARELAALPPETQAQLLAEEQAAAVLATLAPALLKPDFSENFIDPLSPRAVARFALKHGAVLARLPVDGPVRQVQADSLLPGARPTPGRVLAHVVLLTAVVETDTRKSRVLLGAGLQPEVLGRRIHSIPRRAALVALGAGVVGLPLWIWRPPGLALHAGVAAVQPAQASAAAAVAGNAVAQNQTHAQTTAQAPAHAPAHAPAPEQAHEHGAERGAPVPASAPAPGHAASDSLAAASSAAPSAAQPAPAALPAPLAAHGRPSAHAVPIAPVPTAADASASGAPPAEPGAGGRTLRVSIVPPLSAEEKARAREERAALRPAAAAPAAVPPAGAAPAATPHESGAAPVAGPPPPRVWRAGPTPRRVAGDAGDAAPAAAAATLPAQAATPPAPPRAAAPAAGPVFAITTRPLRTRSEAEQVRVAMVSLLRTLGHEKLQVEVLPQGEDWRVVALPFARRAEADQGRTLLVSRGMRVEVVDF